MPSQLLLVFVPVTHSKKGRWLKLVSYIRGSHCTHFGDGAQHPLGPRWPHDKVHANLLVFEKAGCHFEFLSTFWIFKHIFKGQMILEWVKRSTRLQCTSPMSLVDRKSGYNPFLLFTRDHIFPKHGLPFLAWAPPPTHTGTTPPHIHWCLDLVPREKWNFVNFITTTVRELSTAGKLKDPSHAGW